jgi:hypothetical protein
MNDDTLVKELSIRLGEHYYMSACKICTDAAEEPGRSEEAKKTLLEIASTIEGVAKMLPELVARLEAAR